MLVWQILFSKTIIVDSHLFSKVLEKYHAFFDFDRDSKFGKGQKMQKPAQLSKITIFSKKISHNFIFCQK